MYVCICRGVTERHIHSAIERGVRSMRELRAEFGVASCCGKCGPHARQLLQADISGLNREAPQGAAAEVAR